MKGAYVLADNILDKAVDQSFGIPVTHAFYEEKKKNPHRPL